MKLKIFKNNVNQESVDQEFWTAVTASIGLGSYSDVVLKVCITPILDQLKKVEFYSVDPSRARELKPTIDFLNKRYDVIYKYLFKKGYCAVKIDSSKQISFDNVCAVETVSEYEKTLNNPYSTMSFDYTFFGKSTFLLLKEVFENINTGLTAQKAVTKILGQLTFFSHEKAKDNEKVVKLTDEERAKLIEKYNNLFTGDNVGTAIEFTNANLKRDTVLFPLEKLQIVDNVTFLILMVAGCLNVPYDLIPLSGKSTYANQAEAIAYLKNNTVNGIAENMLELGRKILSATTTMIPQSALDYRFVESTTIQQPATPAQPQQ